MIGYDVEFFLSNSRGYIPAERVLGGTKGRGMPIGKGVVAHPDNVMAEIASAAPFKAQDIIPRIQHDVDLLRQHVAPVDVSIVPYINVSKQFLDSSELASEVGCDVDFRNGEQRDPITADVLGRSRYAGGHLHFDVNSDIAPDYAAAVCDIMLAVPCIAHGEQQGGRRGTYGLAGLYRPKSYGVEYRTLSNYWVDMLISESTPNIIAPETFANLIINTSKALEEVRDEVLMLPAKYKDYATEIIETENRDEALNFIQLINKYTQGVI